MARMREASGKSKYNSSGDRMQLALFRRGLGTAGELDLSFRVDRSAIAHRGSIAPCTHVFENLMRCVVRTFDDHGTLNGAVCGNDEIDHEIFVNTGCEGGIVSIEQSG